MSNTNLAVLCHIFVWSNGGSLFAVYRSSNVRQSGSNVSSVDIDMRHELWNIFHLSVTTIYRQYDGNILMDLVSDIIQ